MNGFLLLLMCLAAPASPSPEDVDARFEHLLRRAHEEKEAFIAIIVDGDTGKILAEGINTSAKDPTEHSEVAAIRNLVKARPQNRWHHFIMYTTAEPCPMCSGALVYSKIDRVVYGIDRETLYAKGWHDFRMRAADIIADAKRSGGFVPELTHYTGPHLHACEELFHR